LWLAEPEPLVYEFPDTAVRLEFSPLDFTQVNPAINRALVNQALTLLAPGAQERVLDLFCGMGNFTLSLARRAGQVVGLEGEEQLAAQCQP
jgi:23S rRNA (uracil1939-C5)-methyltransferase